MATFLYSPGITVHVETANGILDLSEDLVSWTLTLRENAIHTFEFVVQNAQRKYDCRLLPMDRISVQLKRLNWLQNFTGLLNDGPIFQAWPGTLNISASCTMKIPQFWYWDPSTNEAYNMVTTALQDPKGPSQGNSTAGDNGLSILIVESMWQVLGWDKNKIHIGQVPNDWMKLASTVGDLIEADASMAAFLGSGAVVAGQPVTTGITIPAGSYGGVTLNAQQAAWATVVYNTTRVTMKLDSSRATMAFMTIAVESTFHMDANSNNPASILLPHDGIGHDHQSVGLYQQQPGSQWGPLEQCMDAALSTKRFQTVLGQMIGNSKPTPLDYGRLCQQTQVSAYPDAYQKLLNFGTALTKIADGLASQGGTLGATNPSQSGLGPANPIGTPATTTGMAVANTAYHLIKDNPPIAYRQGNDDVDTTPVPTVLDCSALADWVYYHASGLPLHSGTPGHGRSTAASIYAESYNITDMNLAYQIQGAGLFINESDGSGIGHVGIALGLQDDKGRWLHVAAHDPKDGVNISPVGTQFNRAALLPHIDYSGSAVTQPAADALKVILKNATSVAPQLGAVGADGTTATPSSPFQSLLNTIIFGSSTNTFRGGALDWQRAPMNNQPFFPWLQATVNASMRSFCSAPNGDFMAWFPDYFGLFGTAGIMQIELIELQDFTVSWSDQQMVTHQYVVGNPAQAQFNIDNASISVPTNTLEDVSQMGLFQATSGLATMDYPEIFEAIYKSAANPAWIAQFIKRFGIRPDVQNMPLIKQGRTEFFMALYLFMQRWANMFTASIPMTFMPEIWPGMLIQIPAYGFQAYVTGVTHTGSYGEGGSFTTQVEVCAPANIGSSTRSDLLALLPNGGPILK